MTGDPDREGGAEPGASDDDKAPLDVDSAFAAIVAQWSTSTTAGGWPTIEDLPAEDDEGPASPTSPAGPVDRTGPADHTGPIDRTEPRGPIDRAGPLGPSGPLGPFGAAGPLGPVGPIPPAVGEPLIPHIGPPPERAEAADEETYDPPEPPPLPRGDAFTMLAWAGVLAGPLFLLVCVLVWQEAPQMYILAAVAAFVGGFVTLVMRMPKHRDDDDDDGAVV